MLHRALSKSVNQLLSLNYYLYYCHRLSVILKHNTKLRACGIESCKGSPDKIGAARKKISTLPLAAAHPPGSIFFTAALAPFYPIPWMSVMLKYILRVNVGGWWLSVGVRFGVKPFLVSWFPSGIKEVYLRLLWLECSISELPF